MPPARNAIRVRMYRVGFGDCFLVSLPEAAGRFKHVLIDCGVHPKGDIKTIAAAVQDVVGSSGGALAAVVASHEHADHISGFGACDADFAKLQVGEIWMPWAMDPEDATAVALRRKRMALAAELTSHFKAGGGTPAALEVLANLRGNERALQALRSRFQGAARRIRYLKAGQKLEGSASQSGAADIDGLSINVLGPPTDPEFLKKMDPPASQRYLKGSPRAARAIGAVRPFEDWLAPGDGRSAFGLSAGGGKRLERELAASLDASLEGLAFALDSAVNNTSLALLLSFRGRTLLFPGDAQWGNWKHWLDSPQAAAILDQLAFLKVAHHGSHNATPRRALEAMSDGAFAAMVSTQGSPWPSIPRRPLMERLKKKTRGCVLRSDSLHVSGAPRGPRLARLPRGFSAGRLWYDYSLPL
jgi:beta-lactamase superfamily II metal-dependent hydrolase